MPGLDGTIEVNVPAGTQPDTVLRLRGKGLPSFGGDYHGDLNLRIEAHIPEHLTVKERKLTNNYATWPKLIKNGEGYK